MAGGARGRAQAQEGAEEGAHCERLEGRAAGAPMLSAPLRVAGDLYLKDQPSLPAFRPSGLVADVRSDGENAQRPCSGSTTKF